MGMFHKVYMISSNATLCMGNLKLAFMLFYLAVFWQRQIARETSYIHCEYGANVYVSLTNFDYITITKELQYIK